MCWTEWYDMTTSDANEMREEDSVSFNRLDFICGIAILARAEKK